MTLHNAVSTTITNQNASPRVAPTAGSGGSAKLESVEDYVVVPASAAADSVFRVVRVPSNCIMKHLYLDSEAQTAGAVDVGVYYANSKNDVAGGSGHDVGTGAAGAQVAADAIDQDFFASAVVLTSAVQKTDIINESGTNTAILRQQPLWQAIGLLTDPGGKFDICATVKTTDVTTGLGLLCLEAQYVAG